MQHALQAGAGPAASLLAEQTEGISSYLARYNLPRRWSRLTAAGSRLRQQGHESNGENTARRASDNPKQNQLVPVPAQGSASHAAGRLCGQLCRCCRMAGGRRHDEALLPDGSWLRDSSGCPPPAAPRAQPCQAAGLACSACGQERKARFCGLLAAPGPGCSLKPQCKYRCTHSGEGYGRNAARVTERPIYSKLGKKGG